MLTTICQRIAAMLWRTVAWLACIGSLATLAMVLAVSGCAYSHSTTTTQPDGAQRTDSLAMSVLSDQPATVRSSDKGEAKAGGSHEPDARTILIRPVVIAGIGLLVVGGMLTLLRAKIAIVPVGASVGMMALGAGMIVFGVFIATPFGLWIAVGAIVVAAAMWGPGLIANIRGEKESANGGLH